MFLSWPKLLPFFLLLTKASHDEMTIDTGDQPQVEAVKAGKSIDSSFLIPPLLPSHLDNQVLTFRLAVETYLSLLDKYNNRVAQFVDFDKKEDLEQENIQKLFAAACEFHDPKHYDQVRSLFGDDALVKEKLINNVCYQNMKNLSWFDHSKHAGIVPDLLPVDSVMEKQAPKELIIQVLTRHLERAREAAHHELSDDFFTSAIKEHLFRDITFVSVPGLLLRSAMGESDVQDGEIFDAMCTRLESINGMATPLEKAEAFGLAMVLVQQGKLLPDNTPAEIQRLADPVADNSDDAERYSLLKAAIEPLDEQLRLYVMRRYFLHSLRTQYSKPQLADMLRAFQGELRSLSGNGVETMAREAHKATIDGDEELNEAAKEPIGEVFELLLPLLNDKQIEAFPFQDCDLNRKISPAVRLIIMQYKSSGYQTLEDKAEDDPVPEYYPNLQPCYLKTDEAKKRGLFRLEYLSPAQVEALDAEKDDRDMAYKEDRTKELAYPQSASTVLVTLAASFFADVKGFFAEENSYRVSFCSTHGMLPAIKRVFVSLCDASILNQRKADKQPLAFNEVIESVFKSYNELGDDHRLAFFNRALDLTIKLEIDTMHQLEAMQMKRLGNSIMAHLAADAGQSLFYLEQALYYRPEAVKTESALPAELFPADTAQPVLVRYDPELVNTLPTVIPADRPRFDSYGPGPIRDLLRIAIYLLIRKPDSIRKESGMFNPRLNPRMARLFGRLIGKSWQMGMNPELKLCPAILSYAYGLIDKLPVDDYLMLTEKVPLMKDSYFVSYECQNGKVFHFSMANPVYGEWERQECQEKVTEFTEQSLSQAIETELGKAMVDVSETEKQLQERKNKIIEAQKQAYLDTVVIPALKANMEECAREFAKGIQAFYNLKRLYKVAFTNNLPAASAFTDLIFLGNLNVSVDDFITALTFEQQVEAVLGYKESFLTALRELDAEDRAARIEASTYLEAVALADDAGQEVDEKELAKMKKIVRSKPFISNLLFFFTGSHTCPMGSCQDFNPRLSVSLLSQAPTSNFDALTSSTCFNKLKLKYLDAPTADERKDRIKVAIKMALENTTMNTNVEDG